MNKKSQSIKDIADALHVAISTVSAVLNNKAAERRISEETRLKVLKYARECGYQPNMMARGLRMGESKIIGMLVEDMANFFFAEIAKKVERILFNSGYKLFYSSTDNDPDKAISLLKAYRDRRVDGYIIAPMPSLEKDITHLIDQGNPVVLFDSYISKAKANCVVIDNYEGTYKATEHLLKNKYRNIAFVTVDSKLAHLEDRKNGYEGAMKKKKLTTLTGKISHNASHPERENEISEFLVSNPGIDAVIFGTNYLAINGLQAIKKLNLQIPYDIAVISFDDNDYFQLITPEITTIAQPTDGFAREITRKLLDNILGKEVEMSETVLKTTLIERASSLPLSKPQYL